MQWACPIFICPECSLLLGNCPSPTPSSWGGTITVAKLISLALLAPGQSTHFYGESPFPIHQEGLALPRANISVRFAIMTEKVEGDTLPSQPHPTPPHPLSEGPDKPGGASDIYHCIVRASQYRGKSWGILYFALYTVHFFCTNF